MLFILGWIVCGLVAAGWSNADFRHRYPEFHDRAAVGSELLWGLAGGPIAVVVAFFVTGFAEHGWNLKGKVDDAPDGV